VREAKARGGKGLERKGARGSLVDEEGEDAGSSKSSGSPRPPGKG
jgi:hypothetical protein